MPKLIECKRKDLLAALDIVMPAMERRNTIPILANVVLLAKGKKISLRGTDLDVSVEYNGVARTGKDKHTVEFTVNAFDLHHFLKNAGDDDLWMVYEPENKQVGLRAGANRTLHTLPVDDFPELSESETPARFDMSIGDMLILIKTVKPGISIEETRYYLNGMFFEPLGANKMCVTATDGHRLHTMGVKADGLKERDTATKVIVPTKTLSVVEKWLTKWLKSFSGETLFVEMGNKHINFRCGSVTVRSRLIDGTFPDWRRVVPSTTDKIAVVDGKKLDAILKNVGGKRSDGRSTKFIFANNKLEISRTDPDHGKISDTMEDVYSAERIEIGFNAAYMRDIITSLGGGEIEIAMSDAGSPTLCRKPGETNPFCVLMPMRV